MSRRLPGDERHIHMRRDKRLPGRVGRAGMAALSLAAVCKAAQDVDAKPAPEHKFLAQATENEPQPRPVFIAKDILGFVEEPDAARERDDAAFTLAKLSAFQKPPLAEELIEPDSATSATCSCNTVCTCVPVQTCSCNTVCTCHSVESCAGHVSGGGGGGGGYWIYAPCY